MQKERLLKKTLLQSVRYYSKNITMLEKETILKKVSHNSCLDRQFSAPWHFLKPHCKGRKRKQKLVVLICFDATVTMVFRLTIALRVRWLMFSDMKTQSSEYGQQISVLSLLPRCFLLNDLHQLVSFYLSIESFLDKKSWPSYRHFWHL